MIPGLTSLLPESYQNIVRQHVTKLLDSDRFRSGTRESILLRYLVESHLSGRIVGERDIARDAFRKSDEFAPLLDPSVRVAARNLRSKLVLYYATYGEDEPLRIELPPRTYAIRVKEQAPSKITKQLIMSGNRSLNKTEKQVDSVKWARSADGVLSLYNEIDWRGLFANARRLDLLFAYAQTWRHNNIIELEQLIERRNSRIRLLLPDPQYQLAVTVLARRSECDEGELKRRILEAADQFKDLGKRPESRGVVQVKYLKFIPLYGLFSFDSGSVLVLHSHREGRHGNPTFLLQDGTIGTYLAREFEALFKLKSKRWIRNA
jgi:hypothetical protein